ncbi:MAG: hypothetical protein QW595_03170 [Candidatus Bathyarchaeia archaeon]
MSRNMLQIVGLRHDVDNAYGLRYGLPKVVSIEEKYGVRSTFFVRVDVVHAEKDQNVLRSLVNKGWEVGLHLINTVGDPKLPSPKSELERLRKLLGGPVWGVTPCGKTIGFKGDATWRVMDSLGLKYMEGYGMPSFDAKTFVIPTHLSFDIYYVRKFGDVEGYRKFREDLTRQLRDSGVATVLVHPEWFVRSVQGKGLLKIPLTLLKKGLMNEVYDKFLKEFKGKVEFKKYMEIYNYLKNEE